MFSRTSPAGPWRPLFKASQILRTEFPEHESFHEEVDSHYRNLVTEQVDNQLRSALSTPTSSSSSSSGSSENVVSGSETGGGSFGGGGGGSFNGGGGGSFSGGGGSFGGGGGGFGGNGFGVTAFNGGGLGGGGGKKHNHMIHLHLIPHIYVPIVHAAGYSESKNGYQVSEEEPPRSPVYHHATTVNASPESFQSAGGDGVGGVSGGGVSGGGGGGDTVGGVSGVGATGPASPTGPADIPSVPSTAAGADAADHGGGFNGHSGETTYYTITEDQVQHVHHDVNEQPVNAVDGQSHDYEAPSSPAPDEPHQYQVTRMAGGSRLRGRARGS